MDKNAYSNEIFKNKLISLGLEVKEEFDYLVVNKDLELTIQVIENPNHHHLIIQLMIVAYHSKFFNDGIVGNVVGMGDDLEEKINNGIDN